ncbi:hypothetical protein [Nonomuraea sp. NPDC050202]|uniref:hypothetical protein n=1 Tax=Nonomuraea sp. NPDC050202 TaxID=3155035 RepID=UPI00340490FB
MTLDAETSATITGYRPQQAPAEWDHIAGHVRMLVAASADRSPYRIERLLTATTRLAVWCHRSGLPDDPEVWLRHETIDAFVLTGCTDLASSPISSGSLLLGRRWTSALRDSHAPDHRHPGRCQPLPAPRWSQLSAGSPASGSFERLGHCGVRGDRLGLFLPDVGCRCLGRSPARTLCPGEARRDDVLGIGHGWLVARRSSGGCDFMRDPTSSGGHGAGGAKLWSSALG